VKRTSKALALCLRLPAAAKHAGLWIAAVASIALVLGPLGPTQIMALAATTQTAEAAAAQVPAGHVVLARIGGDQLLASYLPIDAPLLDQPQLQTFRVRFQLGNDTTEPITVDPQLEYRPDGGDGFVVVPEKSQAGEAFDVARESVSTPGGSEQLPLGADIAVTDLLIGEDTVGLAVSGHHSMGLNPDVPITLPASSYTEQEFTVRLTTDAQFLGGYELRVTDAGAPLAGTAMATVEVGARPLVPVEPGQPSADASSGPSATASDSPGGAASSSPSAATSSSPSTSASTSASTSPGDASSSDPLAAASSGPDAAASTSPEATANIGGSSPSTVRYALAPAAIGDTTSTGIHGPYSLTTDQCGFCHRTHTAKGPNLVTKPGPQSNLCLTCHDGTGAPANLNVTSQYTDPAVPANVVTGSTRDYYSHDAQSPTTHTRSAVDEFGGVSNRHSECSDCHNPHNANGATVSTQTPTGWTASGRVSGSSGVSVVNGAAGTAPAYTFVKGNVSPLTREYELCFKCHSGFTTLPSNSGFAPSSDLLDKAEEFNPNNASFHPIEAPGTNKSAAMDASLAGSPFTTDSTIRCSNCHAGSGVIKPGDPPAAGADLAPHASQFQGILLQNYRDRELKSSDEPYKDADFALCLMCHAKAPYASLGPNAATNFDLHGEHLTALAGKGPGGSSTDIDTPGAGDGNAICAECHFRLHSTTFQVPGQTIDGSRLVNFAPNVQPDADGKLSWTRDGPGGGSCTLTCHGHVHQAAKY
jgi:predicted CXXCH cytochrome family protein